MINSGSSCRREESSHVASDCAGLELAEGPMRPGIGAGASADLKERARNANSTASATVVGNEVVICVWRDAEDHLGVVVDAVAIAVGQRVPVDAPRLLYGGHR